MDNDVRAPLCYRCVHRLPVPGDCHSRCNNPEAKVLGDPHGIRQGWFLHPVNFDPIWLKRCDGFSDDPNDRRERHEYDSITELLGLIK